MADSISGLSGTGGGDMMRIIGMASGMDIDGMIKKMMLAEGKKVDVVKQQKQAIVWKQEIYQDIIKDVKDLQNTYFSVDGVDSLISSRAYSDFNVDSTNSAVAMATATAGAVKGNYGIKVEELARAAKVEGNVIHDTTSSIIDFGKWNDKGITFNINGIEETITLGTSSDINGLKNDINDKIALSDSLKGKVQVAVVGDKIQFQALNNNSVKISSTTTVIDDLGDLTGKVINPSTNTTMGDLGLTATKILKFKYNGSTTETSVEITKDDKISDIINKISQATKEEVKGSFSELTGKFTLETVKTGSTQSIEITTDVAELGLTSGNKAIGNDAVAYIIPPGGTEVKVTKPTNNFTIDGINYNLTGKSEEINVDDPPNRTPGNLKSATLTIAQDTDKTFDRFKNFIDKYNTLIDKINTKLTEKKDYDYKPLTDAQKKDMKDDEIKAWEERAKKGILRNDDNLKNMLSQLRSTFFDKVEGVSTSFGQSIGLDTDGKVSKAGQIKFSDDTGEKFKKALSERPEEIMQLFNKIPDSSISTSDKTAVYNNSGIFQRINTILKDNVGSAGVTLNSAILTKYANKQEDYSIYGYSGTNTLPDQIYRKDNLIKQLNTKLKDKENSLYKKFSALEVVMNKYNAQQGWLAQQFGG